MVSLVWWTSALFGFNSQTNLAYVTSFHLSCRTLCLWTKEIVLVPLIWPPMPCASRPNLLADECIHTLWYFGWVISFQYFNNFSDSVSNTSFANSAVGLSSIIACASSFMLSGGWRCVDQPPCWWRMPGLGHSWNVCLVLSWVLCTVACWQQLGLFLVC